MWGKSLQPKCLGGVVPGRPAAISPHRMSRAAVVPRVVEMLWQPVGRQIASVDLKPSDRVFSGDTHAVRVVSNNGAAWVQRVP